jgi:hypothetical protein
MKYKKNNYFFSFACHHCRAHGCGSLYNVVTVRSIPSQIRSMSVAIMSNIRCKSVWRLSQFCLISFTVSFNVHQRPFVRFHPFSPFSSTNVCSSSFIRPTPFVHWHPSIVVHPHRRTVFLNHILCSNFVASALYYYKILGHGTTPCPQMMRALPFNQIQNMSYKVTHNHLFELMIFTMVPSNVYNATVI